MAIKYGNDGKQAAAPAAKNVAPVTMSLAEVKLARRGDALFRALSTDYLLREQFVTDPAQVMSEYLLGQPLADTASDAANQLVYAVMSSPRLRDWLAAYAAHARGGLPSRAGFATEFARAIATSGDEVATLALIRAAADDADHFRVQADLLRTLVSVLGSRLAPGGGTTEMSPGGTTEMSPGAIFRSTEMSPGGTTEMSPGAIFRSTEMSPGGTTEMSPGAFSTTEMSPGGTTEMSPGGTTEMSPGAFSSTEMSPGGTTEMSPGTATDMSPGGRFFDRIRLAGHLSTTINALVQYSTGLRRVGALSRTGLEGR